MSRRKMMVPAWSSTALVAALSSTESAWLDIGKSTPDLEVTQTSTTGTYALEVDWSRDGGATTMSTDTVTTTPGVAATVTGRARWSRLRVRNTHATLAFTAHSTVATRDASIGR
jgi:hypothetical protein